MNVSIEIMATRSGLCVKEKPARVLFLSEVRFVSESELVLEQMGQRIAVRRKQMNLTQEALAEKANVTTQFVSYAEAGKRAMRPENLLKIAAALGVSTDYLLTGDVVDKDRLLLSEKLSRLSPAQLHTAETMIDACIALCENE